MKTSKELLYQRYISPIKDNPQLLIGVELEFPIVHTEGRATDTTVTKELLAYLARQEAFECVQKDEDGACVQVRHCHSGDMILFEVSYNILEFAFSPAITIQSIEKRFQDYLTLIQTFLVAHHHELQGWGVHPHWAINDNSPVKLPRYQMLMNYLALAKKGLQNGYHEYSDYGAFICGSQVQLDVTRDNLIPTLNTFNQLEPIKAYLFANSELKVGGWETYLSRDIFWEESMHGTHRENIGLYDHDFTDIDDLVTYLDKSSLFTVERQGKILYFPPIAAKDYLHQDHIEAYDLDGKKVTIIPQEADFTYHRSYNYEDLTTRGTIEFRSTCTQPLNQTFSVVAFHLGIFLNMDKVSQYLLNLPLYEKYHHDYAKMRRLFASKTLSEDDYKALKEASQILLKLATEGLKTRFNAEESYLSPLFEKNQKNS
ncbi:gamma-glutamylcysteine synthetase [Streptococcus sp. zg-JUN1979]|uniref:gamma-glutamylcysteine synthetase n=1 Tax=Streptococcus sp. zg-JUN1979 TaxID=3391450 RepID=UPI0039A60CD8